MRYGTFLILFLIVAATAGCTSVPNPEGKPMPVLEYSYERPVFVEVSSVDVRNETGPASGDYVPFVQSVSDTLYPYLRNRFEAIGGAEMLDFRIEDVSLSHAEKSADNKIGQFLGVAGQDVYIIEVQIHAVLRDRVGNMRGKRFKIGRRIFITEHASVAEREKKQLEGLEALIGSLDEALVDSLRREFGIVRLTGPEFR